MKHAKRKSEKVQKLTTTQKQADLFDSLYLNYNMINQKELAALPRKIQVEIDEKFATIKLLVHNYNSMLADHIFQGLDNKLQLDELETDIDLLSEEMNDLIKKYERKAA